MKYDGNKASDYKPTDLLAEAKPIPILPYFYPVMSVAGKWRVSPTLLATHLRNYMLRSAIPALIFWILDAVLLMSHPALAALFITLALAFALVLTQLIRLQRSLRNSH